MRRKREIEAQNNMGRVVTYPVGSESQRFKHHAGNVHYLVNENLRRLVDVTYDQWENVWQLECTVDVPVGTVGEDERPIISATRRASRHKHASIETLINAAEWLIEMTSIDAVIIANAYSPEPEPEPVCDAERGRFDRKTGKPKPSAQPSPDHRLLEDQHDDSA